MSHDVERLSGPPSRIEDAMAEDPLDVTARVFRDVTVLLDMARAGTIDKAHVSMLACLRHEAGRVHSRLFTAWETNRRARKDAADGNGD